uniref:Uncharacterized protein n=1 Tax=Arundo donax TaxID=35708 RepID=A0A0A9GZ80_ARUDO
MSGYAYQCTKTQFPFSHRWEMMQLQ